MSSQAYVIWGSAGHAKVVSEIISHSGGVVVALFDNFQVTPALSKVRLWVGREGFESWAQSYVDIASVKSVVAIGGARGRDRHQLYQFLADHHVRPAQVIHQLASVSPTAKLGAGVQICALANVAAESTLGEACIINHRANVDHECVLGNGVHVAPGATLCGCVDVGDYAFIGAGATILPRIRIGKNAVIGAGAVVVRDVPDDVTIVGNPGTVLQAKP